MVNFFPITLIFDFFTVINIVTLCLINIIEDKIISKIEFVVSLVLLFEVFFTIIAYGIKS